MDGHRATGLIAADRKRRPLELLVPARKEEEKEKPASFLLRDGLPRQARDKRNHEKFRRQQNREEKGKERGAVFLSCSHHSIAAAVEHAIDGPPGTVSIAAIEGK